MKYGKVIMNVIMDVIVILALANNVDAANKYVRPGATGNGSGADWTNAYTTLPSSLTRGDTYYLATGSYGQRSFGDSTSGTQYITIKKATATDHGTDTGWNSSYGTGQAVFSDVVSFSTGYYIFDGNGTHTIPSNNTNDYGIRINSNSSTNTSGIIQFTNASNVTFRYIHVYNTSNGSINNGTVGIRFHPSYNSNRIKIQNCFLENSGKDGIQISMSSYILVERTYIKRYGKLAAGSPDYHGQTVQIFYGGDDIIFRYNVWEANEGQGLVQIAGIDSTSERIRFYGNVVFVGYGQSGATPGFNVSGGILGNAWYYNSLNYIITYNNTFVNIGGDYGGVASHPLTTGGSNNYIYNNLYYNCQSVGITGAWNGNGYHAAGGGETISGTSAQNGLSNSIFTNYGGNVFILASATNAGLTLTSQGWWNGGSDSFFGTVDSALDMYGNTRGADGVWDRGAFEYNMSNPVKIPSAPTIISVE